MNSKYVRDEQGFQWLDDDARDAMPDSETPTKSSGEGSEKTVPVDFDLTSFGTGKHKRLTFSPGGDGEYPTYPAVASALKNFVTTNLGEKCAQGIDAGQIGLAFKHWAIPNPSREGSSTARLRVDKTGSRCVDASATKSTSSGFDMIPTDADKSVQSSNLYRYFTITQTENPTSTTRSKHLYSAIGSAAPPATSQEGLVNQVREVATAMGFEESLGTGPSKQLLQRAFLNQRKKPENEGKSVTEARIMLDTRTGWTEAQPSGATPDAL